jgi:hypothetical protein
MNKTNARDWRVIVAHDDDDSFCRNHSTCLDSPFQADGVLVPKAEAEAYKADRYIVADLSVSDYHRRAPTKSAAMVAESWGGCEGNPLRLPKGDWVEMALRAQGEEL